MIDANALLKELYKFVNPMPDEKGLHYLSGLSTAITEIEDAPTVDAVEVVCCEDCKHSIEGSFDYCVCRKSGLLLKQDDFCSYGERREGE